MKFGAPTIIIQATIYLLLLLIAASSISSCDACTLDGCDHPDCGTCGNACCSLLITIKESTESVMNQLNKSITEGGPDNLYIPMMTHGGTLTFSDLRRYGAGADFLGQALHTTLNGKYNDTVNLSLSPTTVSDNNNDNINATIVAAFSISEVAGAYCDSGQNYWNILQLVQGIQWESGTLDVGQQVEHVGDSCPAALPTIKEETNAASSEDDEILYEESYSASQDILPLTSIDAIGSSEIETEEHNTNNKLQFSDYDNDNDSPIPLLAALEKHLLIVFVGLLFLVIGLWALARKISQKHTINDQYTEISTKIIDV